MRTSPLVAFLVACGLVAACSPRQGDDAADTPQLARDQAFLAEDAAWRQQRRDGLVAVDGWTSLVGLHWLELKAHYIGSGPGSGIRLTRGPDRLGLVEQAAGRVFLTPESGVDLTLDGKPLRGRTELTTDQDGPPSVVGFDHGEGRLTVIERGGRRALRVKHAQADARVRFAGLEYWPADPGWRVAARFEPHPPGKTIEIANILGQLEMKSNPGVVAFERDGQAYRLEAIDEGDGGLFLIFADRTSGHGSYGAGRYIDAAAPSPDGLVLVDFNRAYNPPCAFTAFATCPLPPPENRLDLVVAAGERTYAGEH